ncbi:MAG: alkaline phosphatase D family protein [Methyloglobulus sp.]|nr:hypothetical protein [Methyloglobulus sp.]
MADLMLAGPILRRVTTELVCVWLVTDKELLLRLTILQGDNELGRSDVAKIDEQRSQLGKKLFVYVLQAPPEIVDGAFPVDQLLSYRIDAIVDNNKASPINLKALKLTYGNNANPTFFIPTFLKRILHGSCRKPHGLVSGNEDNFDALSLGDAEIAAHHGDINNRPALLLLTGDQIYADDVTDPIFAMIRQKSVELLGFQELLPNAINPATIPMGGRKALADDNAGFSSEKAANHLFTFAEYAAMYVYVFGNAQNWLPEFASEHNANLRAALEEFHRTLPNVRRLLANIPTYMIFDDHDVTDDWNITGGWYDKVRDSALGHRVVSNALAAYWAFQGWGNEPYNFDYDMVRSIIDFLATDKPSANLCQQYGLTTWKHRGWGYSVPTNPPLFVIDSRTQRQPDGAFYPTQLLDRYALDWLRMEWNKIKVEKERDVARGVLKTLPEWPVFVATTPVMGFAPIEGLQQLGLWAIGAVEDTLVVRGIERLFRAQGVATGYLINTLDAEAWISNRDGFGNFMNCLLHRMEINQCIFLSGDVHYAFTAQATFASKGKNLKCWQLTSSSLSNAPNAHQLSTIDKIRLTGGDAGHNNQWAYNPNQRWKTEIKYISEPGAAESRITSQCNIGLVEFHEGKPVKHTLLRKGDPKVFVLNSE